MCKLCFCSLLLWRSVRCETGERFNEAQRESERDRDVRQVEGEDERAEQPLRLNQSGSPDAFVTRISIIHGGQTSSEGDIYSLTLHGSMIKNK